MFTNKHVVIALLVAPVLSVLAWFGVGHLVGEQPHQAVAGQDYRLLEKSNCRWASGNCDLVNGDVELGLSVQQGQARGQLELQSSIPLEGVMLAVVPVGGSDAVPAAMRRGNEQGTRWQLSLASPLAEGDRLRLVAVAPDNRFSAEVSTAFAQTQGYAQSQGFAQSQG